MPKVTKNALKNHRPKSTSSKHEVSSVAFWYRAGHFKSDEEAQGAFRLANQQGLDGMGASVREWMGLTPDEYSAWYSKDILPSKSSTKTAPGTKPRKQPFKTWLKQFKSDSSPYGDLANDVALDEEFPTLKDSLEPALSHLSYSACHEAKIALKEAWIEYCGEMQFEDQTPRSVYQNYSPCDEADEDEEEVDF